MKLKILSSSSKGNYYVLENEAEALILGCDISFIEVKGAIDFSLQKIAGRLITHEHKDHCKAINEVLKTSVPVYASAGTIQTMSGRGYHEPHPLEAGKVYMIGCFKVLPFHMKHDCAEPFGYLIQHEETGSVLFATDTYYLPSRFQNLPNVSIKANYRLDILEGNITEGRIPKALRDRTLQSHMSLDACRDTLLSNNLKAVDNIVSIHLPNGNNNTAEFRGGTYQAAGKTVHITEGGMILNFNKTPF